MNTNDKYSSRPEAQPASTTGRESDAVDADDAEPIIRVSETAPASSWFKRSGRLALGLLRRLQSYGIVLNKALDWLFNRLRVTTAVILMLRTSGLVVALASPVWPLVAVLQVGWWGWLIEVIVNLSIGLALVGAAETMQKIDALSQMLTPQDPRDV